MIIYGNKFWQEDSQRGEGVRITINDDSSIAKKIRQGYDFNIVDGEIIIKVNKTKFDIKNFKSKLTAGTATLADIKEFLIKHLIK